jgi:hypothetical protein
LRRRGAAHDLHGDGRERDADQELGHADAAGIARHQPLVCGAGEHTAAGDGMAVDRGHHRPGVREYGGEHRAQRRQEFPDVGHAAVEEPLEVDAGGEDVPAAGHHHGGGLRGFPQARGQRLTEFEAHGVGLPVSHADERHAVLFAELDHVACSPWRIAAPTAVAPMRAGRRSRRSACTTAIASTTIAPA